GGNQGFVKWDGTAWSAVAGSANGGANALCAFDDGSGPALYAGGIFEAAGSVAASSIAAWKQSSWHTLGSGHGIGPTNEYTVHVDCMAVVGVGATSRLYAGGTFTTAGSQLSQCIASFDGTSWTSLSTHTSGNGNGTDVVSLCAFDDGSGAAAFA